MLLDSWWSCASFLTRTSRFFLCRLFVCLLPSSSTYPTDEKRDRIVLQQNFKIRELVGKQPTTGGFFVLCRTHL